MLGIELAKNSSYIYNNPIVSSVLAFLTSSYRDLRLTGILIQEDFEDQFNGFSVRLRRNWVNVVGGAFFLTALAGSITACGENNGCTPDDVKN